MNNFDMLIAAVAANPGNNDTELCVLMDYCREELRSDSLAELIQAKIDLKAYKPVLWMTWIRNPCQEACDLRVKIRHLEEDMLEDGLDREIRLIEDTFVKLVSHGRRNWENVHETLIMQAEMRHLGHLGHLESWRAYTDQYTTAGRDDIMEQMRQAAANHEMQPPGHDVSTVFRGVPVVTVDQL